MHLEPCMWIVELAGLGSTALQLARTWWLCNWYELKRHVKDLHSTLPSFSWYP